MKRLRKVILLVAFISLGGLVNVRAGDAPCKKSDLLGTWEISRLDVIRRPEHANMPLLYRYQKRIFRPDGKMRHYVTQTPITPEQEKEFEKTPANVHYKVEPNGIVSIRVFGSETDRFRCLVVGPRELEFVWPAAGAPTLIHRFVKRN
jgi:hypothetical protein